MAERNIKLLEVNIIRLDFKQFLALNPRYRIARPVRPGLIEHLPGVSPSRLTADERRRATGIIDLINGRISREDKAELRRVGLMRQSEFVPMWAVRDMSPNDLTINGVKLLLKYLAEDNSTFFATILIRAGRYLSETTITELERSDPDFDPNVIMLLRTGRNLKINGGLTDIYDSIKANTPQLLPQWISGIVEYCRNEPSSSHQLRALWDHAKANLGELSQTNLETVVLPHFELLLAIRPNNELSVQALADPTRAGLAVGVLSAAVRDEDFITIAHLCQSAADVEAYSRLVSLSVLSFVAMVKREASSAERVRLIEAYIKMLEAAPTLITVDKDPGLLYKLLNKERIAIPVELSNRIVKLYVDHDPKNYRHALRHFFREGVQVGDIPAKIEEIGKQLAEVAHRTLEAVRSVVRRTKKPTVTVYILSTAHGFNGERILDAFYKNPAARQRLLAKIGAETRLPYAASVKELYRFRGTELEEAEMKIIYQAFYSYVDYHQKTRGLDRLSAIMKVAQVWINNGYLDYFSYPIELKIASNPQNPVAPGVQAQLRDLATKAKDNGWDIILIDHSTVRTAGVMHDGDVPEAEKGRAIARGMQMLAGILGEGMDRLWLYKDNDWKLAADPAKNKVNVVGLNLYDGPIYEFHWRGRKEGWLPIDDRMEMVGVEVNGEVREAMTIVIPVGELEVGKKAELVPIYDLYWDAFRQELASMEGWSDTVPSFKFGNILFVCKANHHRSTTFEVLLTHLMRSQYGPDAEKLQISSAGLKADEYLMANPERAVMSARAKKMLADQGVMVEDGPKNQLDHEMVAVTDLILVMTERQKKALLDEYPEANGKVKTVKEYLNFPEEEWNIPTPKKFNEGTFAVFEGLARRLMERLVA